MTTKTARQPKPYNPAALIRVSDKKTGACLGYLAPSRDGKTHYEVTHDDFGYWHCTCESRRQCCHIKAVKEICELRAKQGKPGCFHGEGKELAGQPATSATPVKKRDETPGTLHSAARGSFLDTCFGSLASDARYRAALVAHIGG